MIETSSGLTAVEALAKGHVVRTLDQGFQLLRWIGSRKLTIDQLEKNPALRPIRITAGTPGPKTPSEDLVISPQHRVLVRSKIAQRMFGTAEVLVAAKQLSYSYLYLYVDDAHLLVVFCGLLQDLTRDFTQFGYKNC